MISHVHEDFVESRDALLLPPDVHLKHAWDEPQRHMLQRTPSSASTAICEFLGVSQKPLALVRSTSPAAELEEDQRVHAHLECKLEENNDAIVTLEAKHNRIARLCELCYRNLVTTRWSGELDETNQLLSTSEDLSVWIVFSQRPVFMAFSKRWFQILVAMAGLAYLLDAGFSASAALNMSSVAAPAYRLSLNFTGEGDGRAGEYPTFPALRVAGLTRNGCEIPCLISAAREGQVERYLLNLTSPQPVDGWYAVRTDNASVAVPVHYEWERYDQVVGWTAVEYPPWFPTERTQRLSRSPVYFLDLSPPLLWEVYHIVGSVVISLAYLSSAACGAARRVLMPRWIIAAAGHLVGCFALSMLAACILSVHEDGQFPVVVYLLFTVEALSLASLAYSEKYQVDLFFMYTVMRCAAHTMRSECYYPMFGRAWVKWLFLLSSSYLIALAAFGLVVMRSLVLRWVTEILVRDDRLAYAAEWQKATAEEGQEQAARAIEQACSLAARLAEAPRQSYALAAEPAYPDDERSRAARKPRTSAPLPVSSLDQLYDQAAFVDTCLRDKVLTIGHAANGYFVLNDGSEADQELPKAYERFSRVLDGSVPRFRVGWAPLKSPQRALEKLLRCYGGDVSRLLDCCRQRILFDRIADIRAGLALLLADPEIRVVRLKNLLGADHGSDAVTKLTGGFRCHGIMAG